MKVKSIFNQPVSSVEVRMHPTQVALFGVAALQILVGTVGWFVHSRDADIEQLRWFVYTYDRAEFNWLDWSITFSGILYIASGIAARRFRIPAASIGAGLYLFFLAFQASQSFRLLTAGLITKISVIVLLLAAVVLALRRSRIS